ncbi:MAG: glycosyltransferase [Candidatus Pacearchaeota archaeon]
MLTLIVPAYNEERRIGRMLEEYCAYIKKNKIECCLFIVVNNTKDNTIGIIKSYQKKYDFIDYIDLVKGGKGHAILEGIKYSLKKDKTKMIGFVDADLSTRPEDFFYLYRELIKNHNLSGVIASRWLKNSKTERKLGKLIRSKGFNFLVRSLFLFNYRDTQCGAKLFKREVFEKIIGEVKSMEWAFDVDILYLCKKYDFRIKELPTNWTDKEGSKISFKVPIQMAAGVIRLRLINSPFRFIVRFYDEILPYKLKVHKN